MDIRDVNSQASRNLIIRVNFRNNNANMSIVFQHVFCAPFRFGHNFLNTHPILTRPAPTESWDCQLSIGAGLVKIRSVLRKLWAIVVKNGAIQDCAVETIGSKIPHPRYNVSGTFYVRIVQTHFCSSPVRISREYNNIAFLSGSNPHLRTKT